MPNGERVEEVPGHDFERWTLDRALAWVLYLDMHWVEKLRPGTLRPSLPMALYSSADPVDTAWRELHKLMSSDIPLTMDQGAPVRIPVFGTLDGGGGNEVVIAPEEMTRLDWRLSDDTNDIYLCTRRGLQYLAYGAIFYRNVSVPRRAVQYNFPPSGTRRMGGILETHGAPALPDAGYVWLTRAAYWIATKGGTVDFLPDDDEMWWPALEQLRNAIAGDKVALIGRAYRSGITDRVDGFRVAGIEIIPPCGPYDLEDIFHNRPRLTFGALHFTDADWYKDGGDKICGIGRQIEYTHLQVKADDVRDLWPFEIDSAATSAVEADIQTGTSAVVDKKEVIRRYQERTQTLLSSTEDECMAFLRTLVPDMPRSRVREIRKEHAPEAWTRRGRKSAGNSAGR